MKFVFPKSITDSQQYVAWGFPALLAYVAISFPVAADWVGQVGLTIGGTIIFTGWLSFGIIPEEIYNDVLLMTDLGLLVLYCQLLYYVRLISLELYDYDYTVLSISGMIFLLYSIWDIAALKGRDTAASATEMHLKRFAYICFFLSMVFFSLAHMAFLKPNSTTELSPYCRLAGGIIWVAIVFWWHIGRMTAALCDGKKEG